MRATWTTPERKEVRRIFRHYLNPQHKTNPSLETCQEFIQNVEALRNRSANQVRAWVINERDRNGKHWF